MTSQEIFLQYNFYNKTQQDKNNKKIAILLHATYNCNASCYYCENQHLTEKFRNKVISKEYVTQLLEKLGQDIHLIILHGGEPLLLSDDWLQHLVNEKERLGLKCKINLQTNGILLTKKKIKFLKKLRINWGTSFNGLHNTESRGQQSTDALLNMINNKWHSSFISVYDSTTYKNLIPNYEYYKTLNIKNIQSSIMHDIKSEMNSPAINTDLNILYDYINYWILDTNHPIKDKWIIRQIERVLGKTRLCENVNCIGKWLVVDPDGNLCHCGYDCESKSHIYCNINDINNIKELKENLQFQTFCVKQQQLINNKCNDCKWLPVCNGGCMKNNFNYDKTFSSINPVMCEFTQTILNYVSNLILDIDITDKKYNPLFIKVLKDNNYISLTEILKRTNQLQT